MKVIIIGGVAGGATCATRLRRLKSDWEIKIYERDYYISYANCGIPYYIGGLVPREKLFVTNPQEMKKKYNIDVFVRHEVIKIDPKNKKVFVKNLESGEEFEDSYDYLVLSPGASPIKPKIPGIDSPRIYTLRTISDADKIVKEIENGAKEATVVGGGFIGIEVTENLVRRGVKVNLVEALPQVLSFIDKDLISYVHDELTNKGVKLFLGSPVKEFRENDKIETILENGEKVTSDFVVFSIGVKPEINLAKDAGLTIGETGGILVNEKMQTSDQYIYAIGDAVEILNFVSNTKTRVPLAGPTHKQARVAADSIAGINSKYLGSMGTAIVKIFYVTAASTGLNSQTLEKLGIDYKFECLSTFNHAGYYPDAYPIYLKVFYENKTGKLLGGQAVGYDGIDTIINSLATALRFNAKITELKDVDFAYSPQYGHAKNPLNIVATMAEDDLSGFAPKVSVFEVDDLVKKGAVLLDIREKEETIAHKLPDSVNIPLSELKTRINELSKDKTYIICCSQGQRAYNALRFMLDNGFNAMYLSGGLTFYDSCFSGEKKEVAKKIISEEKKMEEKNTIKIDAKGLSCPGPLMKLKEVLDKSPEDATIEIESTDPGFYRDISSYCESKGLKLISLEKDKVIKAVIKKGEVKETPQKILKEETPKSDSVSIILFSNDFDKVMAAFIIGNGALSMGKEASVFCTFWGLNILRKDYKVDVKKSFIEKMFGMMMPRGAKEITLSKLNMLGMGTKMMRGIMKKYNVYPPEELLKMFIQNGGKVIACSMTMNLMGIKREELIDGIEEGGVGTYLSFAEKSGINLFI
jgi:NADPH-dependent 2,4-dienoyl-CoA reductase/sulfur reductase-like enzyme/peroxiredoxin family protein/TusA-related sulfurtransferase/rhodanese-related sulfurtransferase